MNSSVIKRPFNRLVLFVLSPFGRQLTDIKANFAQHRMNERLMNKIGQVLYLHFTKWQPEDKNTKLGEIKYAERLIGRMGEKSKIELVKPFGYSRLTDLYLKDFIAIKNRLNKLIPPNSDILDLGCGGGWLSIFLSYEGYNVDGIEISSLAVEIAQKRYEAWPKGGRCRFITADYEDLRFDKTYDAILIYEALHHAQEPQRAIERAAMALKKGGCLILKEPNLIWSFTGIRSSFINENKERGFSKKYLRKILKDSGFTNIRFFKNRLGFYMRYIFLTARYDG